MRTSPLLFGLLTLTASAAVAQEGFVTPASAIGGAQVRRYSFGPGLATTWVRQVAVPLAVVFPVGRRLSVDIGSSYASTTVRDSSGSKSTLSGLTDTQIRASYVFGNDFVVTTVMVNLPTGKKSDTTFKTGVAGNNFLQFPVNSYRNGPSATGGLAIAGQTGGWNLGAAGSLRWTAKYEPFSGSGNLKYRPGVEGRFRVGVDRLVGSSRVAAGFTFSTFSDDRFTNRGVGPSSYSPGNRYIGEVSVTAPVGSGSLSAYGWNFYRSKRDTVSAQVGKEDILAGGISGNFQIAKKVALQPVAEARFWYPEQGRGNLFGGGTAIRFELTPELVFVPSGRYDYGRIRSGIANYRRIKGWEVSGLLRYTFR